MPQQLLALFFFNFAFFSLHFSLKKMEYGGCYCCVGFCCVCVGEGGMGGGGGWGGVCEKEYYEMM